LYKREMLEYRHETAGA